MESSQPPPASSNALIATLANAVQALGRGFDVTSDTRLLYCKGAPGSRLVLVEEGRARDFVISDDGNVVLPDVSLDIDIFREQGQLETTPAYSFQQVSQINSIYRFPFFCRSGFVWTRSYVFFLG